MAFSIKLPPKKHIEAARRVARQNPDPEKQLDPRLQTFAKNARMWIVLKEAALDSASELNRHSTTGSATVFSRAAPRLSVIFSIEKFKVLLEITCPASVFKCGML